MKPLAILLFGAAALMAGCNQCDNFDRPPTELIFLLNDANGKNRVGKAPGLYHPDSLRLSPINGRLYISTDVVGSLDKEYVLGADPIEKYSVGKGQVRVYLYLSKTDTDTLDVTYQISKGQCFAEVEYTAVEYNSRPGQQDYANSRWLLTK